MKKLYWAEIILLVMAAICLCSCRSTSGTDHDQIVRTSIDLAEAYRSQGRLEMAVDVYDRALTQADDYRLYYNKALILSELGRYDDAANLCSSSFESYPYIMAFKRAQALNLRFAGNNPGFYDVSLQILQLSPYDRETRMRLIEAYAEDGLDDKAYEQALILWSQGYMTDIIHQYLKAYKPDLWENINL